MPTIHLHINGLTHHDIAEQREVFIASAVGRRMVLRAAPCREDARAVAAYVGVKMVGYVARTDLDTAWSAMRGLGTNMLRGEVESAGTYYVVFSCFVERLEADGGESTAVVQDWCCAGPLLPELKVWQRLDYLGDELEAQLREEAEPEEILEFLDVFCQLAPYDISRDMLVCRRRLRDALAECDDERLSVEAVEQIEQLSRRMGGNHLMEDVGNWMKTSLTHSAEASAMMQQTPATLKWDEMERSAQALPGGLLTEWRTDATQFARVIYGMCLKREEVRRVLSCLVWLEWTEKKEGAHEADVDDSISLGELADRVLKEENETKRLELMDSMLHLFDEDSRWTKHHAKIKSALKKQRKAQQKRQQEMNEAVKKAAERSMTQNNFTIELVDKKETHIDKNYGPNIEQNGGTLSLPNKNEKQ